MARAGNVPGRQPCGAGLAGTATGADPGIALGRDARILGEGEHISRHKQPPGPRLLARAAHLGLLNYPWRYLEAVLLALALLGGVSFWRTGRQPELLCLWLPALMALAAAFLHRWPFGGNQHMVFSAAAALVLVAEGTEALCLRLARWRWWSGWTCVTLLLLPGVADAAYRILSPRQKYELRPVIEFVQRYLQPGDQLLVFDPAAVEFYTGRDFRKASVEPNPIASVWVISIHNGYKRSTFTAQDVLDRMSAR